MPRTLKKRDTYATFFSGSTPKHHTVVFLRSG